MGNGKTQGSAARKATLEADEGQPLRFVTAASLFDGHDAAINIIRRLLQAHGAEVVHLGHNRSVADIVRAAIQEDADGIALSAPTRAGTTNTSATWSTCCASAGAGHIRVVGRRRRHDRAATRSTSCRPTASSASTRPKTARTLGLDGMIEDVFAARTRACRAHAATQFGPMRSARSPADRARDLGARARRGIRRSRDTCARQWQLAARHGAGHRHHRHRRRRQVVSSPTSCCKRFLRHFPDRSIAVVAVDPTRRRTGGALLGDRIRMNSLRTEQRLHALAGHAPPAPRDQRGAGGRASAAQVARAST